jgi:hypothetical protein
VCGDDTDRSPVAGLLDRVPKVDRDEDGFGLPDLLGEAPGSRLGSGQLSGFEDGDLHVEELRLIHLVLDVDELNGVRIGRRCREGDTSETERGKRGRLEGTAEPGPYRELL